MTTPASSLGRAARLCAVVLLAACASHAEKAEDGSDPPQAAAFRTYVAATLHIPESHIGGGLTSEAEAAQVAQRVGTIWAMTMFHVFEPEIELRGWATPDGTVITVGQAGTMTFVGNFGGAGGGPHDLTRFDIVLTRDHSATVTRTALPPPQAP